MEPARKRPCLSTLPSFNRLFGLSGSVTQFVAEFVAQLLLGFVELLVGLGLELAFLLIETVLELGLGGALEQAEHRVVLQGDALVDLDMVANDSCLPDNNACAVVNAKVMTNGCAWMNIYPCFAMGVLCNDARDVGNAKF